MANKGKRTNYSRKNAKRTAKTAEKVVKTMPLWAIILLVVIIAVVGVGGYFVYTKFIKKDAAQGRTIVSGELTFHFLELGNNYTGDCTYIKAGDVDILIDAGSRKGSAKAISEYVDNYCTDGKLEYVIATHAHQDHIAGFVGTSTAVGVFKKYECETIIKFAGTNATTAIYNDFNTELDKEMAAGAKCYTALDCWKSINGARRIYDLTGDGAITMEILYQKFYENKTSDENDYSVCVLFRQGANSYLFTGDLEEKGEQSLVSSNSLPKVELFKGGHHGSYTASTDALLSVIKPKRVCVCCCAGSVEYLTGDIQNMSHTFPSQEFINRVSKYTTEVYITTMGVVAYDPEKEKYVDKGYRSFNGNIVVICNKDGITVNCSDNNLPLKDTEWFRDNRTRPTAWA